MSDILDKNRLFKDITATVLLVDDNPDNLSVLTNYLKGCGLKLAVATSGTTAIKRAKLIRPDLILLDVMMPDIDGFETCRRLKSDDETKDIPVIFMTALADEEAKIKGLTCGAVEYVSKPFRQEEVLFRINTQLKIGILAKRLEKANSRIEELKNRIQEENRGTGRFFYTGLNARGIIYRARKKKCEILSPERIPAGLTADTAVNTADRDFSLEQDDILIFYTDGKTEVSPNDYLMLKSNQLARIIENNAHKSIEEIKESVLDQVLNGAGIKQNEDVSIIMFRRE